MIALLLAIVLLVGCGLILAAFVYAFLHGLFEE